METKNREKQRTKERKKPFGLVFIAMLYTNNYTVLKHKHTITQTYTQLPKAFIVQAHKS